MISFLEKLDAQLDLYLDMAKEVSSIEEANKTGDINDLIGLIIKRKYDEFHTKSLAILDELTAEQLEFRKKLYEFTDDLIRKDPLTKKIYNDLVVVSDENGELTLESVDKIVGITQFIEKRQKDGPINVADEKKYKYQSIVVSICSSLENFFADVFKDFYKLDSKNKNFDSVKIPFEELKGFTTIEDARNFLIDDFLDGLFRKSFNTWIETANEFNTLNHFPSAKDDIRAINELFQRRNLYVHTGGIISWYYFKYTDKIYHGNLKVGEPLEVDREYIENIIDSVRKLAYYNYFSYYLRIKNYISEDNFDYTVQAYYVNRMHLKCQAVCDIFKVSKTLNCFDQEQKIVAGINYYLYHRLHKSFDSVKVELENFDVKPYEVEYKMAKSILLEQEDAFELTKRYFDTLDEAAFLMCCDWPLMNLVKKKTEFADYFNEKISVILTGKKPRKRKVKGAIKNEPN